MCLRLYLKRTETESKNYDDEEYKVYVSGGLKYKVKFIDPYSYSTGQIVHNKAVYKLNHRSNEWELFSKLKSRRTAHQCAIVKDQLYLVGGSGRDLVDTDVVPILRNGLKAEKAAEISTRRSLFGMCSFAGIIFAAGGLDSRGEDLDECEIYSAQSNEWTEVARMNSKRSSLALVYFQHEVWAVGGCRDGESSNAIETYDPAENKWTTIDAKLQVKRRDHSAVVHGKKIFVIGGVRRNKPISSVEVYSSVTNEITCVAPMNIARFRFGCCLVNSKVYAIGGRKDWNKTNTYYTFADEVEVYDIEKNEWRKGPSLPFKLSDFACSESL